MSFDICVFHASAAPHQPIEFEKWYGQMTDWDVSQEYDNVSVCQSDLQEWYRSMTRRFPVMNGRGQESSARAFLAAHSEVTGDEADMLLEDSLADYALSPNLIYAAFNWKLATEVYTMARNEAFRLGLGFFDLYSGRVYFSPSDIMQMIEEYGKMPKPSAPLVMSTAEQAGNQSQNSLNELEKNAFTDKKDVIVHICFILGHLCCLCLLLFQKVFDFNKWDNILGFGLFLYILIYLLVLFIRSMIASIRLKVRTGCFFRGK